MTRNFFALIRFWLLSKCMSETDTLQKTGNTGDCAVEAHCEKEETYQIELCMDSRSRPYDVEATSLGIEIEGSVINWAWVFRQLAKLHDIRQ